jgi:hypothetical protein
MRVRERDRRPVRELVDEEPIADKQCGNHASRRNAKRLDEERFHEEIDDDGAEERFEVLPQPLADRLRRFRFSAAARFGDDVAFGRFFWSGH